MVLEVACTLHALSVQLQHGWEKEQVPIIAVYNLTVSYTASQWY